MQNLECRLARNLAKPLCTQDSALIITADMIQLKVVLSIFAKLVLVGGPSSLILYFEAISS